MPIASPGPDEDRTCAERIAKFTARNNLDVEPGLPFELSHEYTADSRAGYSANRFLLLGHRNPAGFFLGFGLGQEAEARLAPGEIDADIQKRIGTPAWAGKFHDCDDTVGLAYSQRHRPSRGMVRRRVDA